MMKMREEMMRRMQQMQQMMNNMPPKIDRFFMKWIIWPSNSVLAGSIVQKLWK